MKGKTGTAAKGGGTDAGCVCLRLTHPAAEEVCIAGSFNDWRPSVTPMIRLGDGQWAKRLGGASKLMELGR